MTMPGIQPSDVPRGRRIPLSRFWLDWRISLFLVGVCLVVAAAALGALWGGPSVAPSFSRSSPVIHRERAQLYEGLGRIEDAIVEYQAALRLSPADPALHRALALLFEKEGRSAEAIVSYERSLQLAPAGAEAVTVRTRLEELRRQR
jgi:tetratricopeptide (TPR) repeat protein